MLWAGPWPHRRSFCIRFKSVKKLYITIKRDSMFIREMESSLPEIKPINQRPAINSNWRRYRKPCDPHTLYVSLNLLSKRREVKILPIQANFKNVIGHTAFDIKAVYKNPEGIINLFWNEYIQGSNPRRYSIVNTKNILTNFKGVKYILIIGYSNMNHERLQKKLTPKWYEQFKAQIPEVNLSF